MSAAAGERPAILVVVNPSGQRRRVALTAPVVHVGRQSDNQLVLRDNRVSRVHARIERSNGDFLIEDLQSRHGVYVNGEKIVGRRRLNHGDSIGFGFPDGYQILFQREETTVARLAEQVVEKSRSTVASSGGNLAKLRALVEVARALQGSFSIQEVLESVVEAALAVTGCERGFLMLKEGADLDVKVARNAAGVPLSKDDLKVPTSLIRKALNQRRDLLSMHFDPGTEGATDPDVSVARLELRSCVCMPLVRVRTGLIEETVHGSLTETVGLLYLDSRFDLADLSSGNRELLQTLALEASTVLENARLLEEERARQRLENELRIARDIQQGLLPKSLPETGWFRVAASSVSSMEVGGDYYDVGPIAPDSWAVVLADVSGKGVSSALLAALLQGSFLLASSEPADMEQMISRLNRYLYERTEGEKYATLFYATVAPDGRMHWINAGHCKPILVRAGGGMELLDTSGMPVGMLDFATFDVRAHDLQSGDKLIIYSDGITEAQNKAGEYFGTERIDQVLQANAAMPCGEVHEALQAAVAEFTCGGAQRDDMTLVVLEYTAP